MKRIVGLFVLTLLASAVIGLFAQSEGKEYVIGETWTVDGQWSVTITHVEATKERNEYSDYNPAAVYAVDYTYTNLGYVDENGIMDGLFINIVDSVVDCTGMMGYEYPLTPTNYPQETPVGATCKAQAFFGVENKGTPMKLIFTQYDGNGKKQTATFVIESSKSNISGASYKDAASFEAALNKGADLTGETVTFRVDSVVPNSMFGYNLQAGEHLNFCSSKNPGVSAGDTITVKITEIKSVMGSYIISYSYIGAVKHGGGNTEITSISLDQTNLSMTVGQTIQLHTSIEPEDATDKSVSWMSDNPDCVSVDNGLLQALSSGTATITAETSNQLTASCIVNVITPSNPERDDDIILATSVSLDHTKLDMTVGETFRLKANVSPQNTTDKTVFWVSDNPDCVSVDSGILRAISVGTVTITVQTSNQKVAHCIVTVKKQSDNDKAFDTSTADLILPEGIQSIDDRAFMNINVKSVVIPASCVSIGHKAFAYCSKLQVIYFKNGDVNVADDFILYSPNVKIIAPAGSIMAKWNK